MYMHIYIYYIYIFANCSPCWQEVLQFLVLDDSLVEEGVETELSKMLEAWDDASSSSSTSSSSNSSDSSSSKRACS